MLLISRRTRRAGRDLEESKAKESIGESEGLRLQRELFPVFTQVT